MIKIWDDAWLPTVPHRIQSLKPMDCWINWVSELINPETGTWNIEIIQILFSRQEADQIAYVPLPSDGAADSWVWIPDARGNFMVKSRYYKECHRSGLLAEFESSEEDNANGKRL